MELLAHRPALQATKRASELLLVTRLGTDAAIDLLLRLLEERPSA